MSRKTELRLTPGQRAAHDAVCADGGAGYLDEEAGPVVLCADALRRRGTCCGHACRHCPHDWVNVPSHLLALRRRMAADGGW